jgi:hypothetical protein
LHREVIELLGDAVLRVPDFLAVLDRAGVDPEQGDIANVRLGNDLEDVSDQRALGRGWNLGWRRRSS